MLLHMVSTSFIASPVFDGNKKIGVLAFQMPLEKITEIANARAGQGETGETYFVGQDLKLRSDSYEILTITMFN